MNNNDDRNYLQLEELGVELSSWMIEEIQGAEVGEEGYFDIKGFRIHWRKSGTNPNDWDIIDVQALTSSINEADLDMLEKRLKDFGIMDDINIQKKMSKIRLDLTKQKTTIIPVTQPINNVFALQQINKLPTLKKLVQNPFFKQTTMIVKMNEIHKNTIIDTDSFDNWFIKMNLQIYKKWMKNHSLIQKINKKK